MPRVYVRKFDWDKARTRHAAGESYAKLAEAFGVSPSAVQLACNDKVRRASAERHFKWQREAWCIDCGAQVTRLRRDDAHRCRDCADKAKATSVRGTTLRCASCQEWKPDEGFSVASGGRKLRRGRNHSCRVCQTKQRQDYRERHKVPCIGCGALVLPPNEKTTGGAPFPRCRECFYAGVTPNS